MSTYTFRRDLKPEDWARAIGIGAAVGAGAAVAVTYLARVFMQRTPLREPSRAPSAAPPRRAGRA